MNIPDRLCAEKNSPYYDLAMCRKVRVYMDEVGQNPHVLEYCISEGWLRRFTGKDRKAVVTLTGVVRVDWKPGIVPSVVADPAKSQEHALEAQRLAQAKRVAKAARQARGLRP